MPRKYLRKKKKLPHWSKTLEESESCLIGTVGLKLLHSHNTNTSGNIIKHNLRTSMNERTHLFIKIYLSHFILERVDVSVVCERWVERHTQWEDFFFPYLLSGARGCQRLHSLANSSERPLIGCMSHARLRFSAFSLNLTAWFSSRDPLPVTHLFDLSALMSRHLPVYESKCDSLPKHMGSQETNRKSMSYVL